MKEEDSLDDLDDTPDGVCEYLAEALESLRRAHKSAIDNDMRAGIRSAIVMIRYLINESADK